MVDRPLSVLLILSVIELVYVNQRLNVNILHTVSTKYFLLFRITGSYDKPINIIARSLEHDEGNTMTLRCEMFWNGSKRHSYFFTSSIKSAKSIAFSMFVLAAILKSMSVRNASWYFCCRCEGWRVVSI